MLKRIFRIIVVLALGLSVLLLGASSDQAAQADSHIEWVGSVEWANTVVQDTLDFSRTTEYKPAGPWPEATSTYVEMSFETFDCSISALSNQSQTIEGSGRSRGTMQVGLNSSTGTWLVRALDDPSDDNGADPNDPEAGITSYTVTSVSCPEKSGGGTRTFELGQCCFNFEDVFSKQPIDTGETDPNPQYLYGSISYPTGVEGSLETYSWSLRQVDCDFSINSDADSLVDCEEIDLGTNPEDADTDGDGYNDDVEVSQGSDPLDSESTPDRDGDGVNDGSDNCPDTANPGQEDADADGYGDVCDINVPPIAIDDQWAVNSLTGPVGWPIPVLANDIDPDSPDLEIVQLTQPNEGSVSIEGAPGEQQFVVYTIPVCVVPRPEGIDYFTYAVTDGESVSAPAVVAVVIIGWQPPVCPTVGGDPVAIILIDDTIDLVGSSEMPKGTATSLTAKLEAARAAYLLYDYAEALEKLNDVLRFVDAQEGKKITTEDASIIRTTTQAAISQVQSEI